MNEKIAPMKVKTKEREREKERKKERNKQTNKQMKIYQQEKENDTIWNGRSERMEIASSRRCGLYSSNCCHLKKVKLNITRARIFT